MPEHDRIESVIGTSLVVRGDIQSSGTLRVDGIVEGTITAEGSVVVAKNGRVKADVAADHVVVGGNIEGSVIARKKVEILSTGALKGGVTTIPYGLIIQEGAIFEGSCKMEKLDGAKVAIPKSPKSEKDTQETDVTPHPSRKSH